MAETVLRVNRLTADEDASATELAQAILDDYALTNKVLRVVNSAIYGRSNEVTTISRAIVVLGWNPIRSLVLTLKLFDALPESPSTHEVKALMGESFCTGMVARSVATTMKAVREEEAFICGLFHHFGELLVHFYLPEAQREIGRLVKERSKKVSVAARLVLGSSHADLGMAVAEELKFPKLLTACMHSKPIVRTVGRPTPAELLTGLTAFSGRVKTALLAQTKPAATQAAVATLFGEFERRYGPVGASAENIITNTLEVMEEHASLLGLPIRSRELVQQITESYFVRVPKQLTEDIGTRSERHEAAGGPETIMLEGIEEAKRTGLRSLNDVLLVVLETMFRGMSFAPVARATFLIRDPAHPALTYRCGLGEALDGAAQWFKIPLNSGRDVFNLAIQEQKDLVISDISSIGAQVAYPPAYQRRAVGSGYVVLLPIVVKDKPIGVFFVEGRRPHSIDAKHLDLLKGLRDAVVHRIEQASALAA